MNAVNINGIRYILAAIVLLAIGLLASCGGAGSMDSLDEAGIDNAAPVADIEAPAVDIADADAAVSSTEFLSVDEGGSLEVIDGEAERSASGTWYVATAGADYVNGVDMLFQLWTDGMGNYEFRLKATNNSADTKLLVYNKDKRYQFLVSQNGQLRKLIQDHKLAWFPEFKPLAPYQTIEYRRAWDGRDSQGNKLKGIVDVEARHVSSSHPSTMKAIAWMNGQ